MIWDKESKTHITTKLTLGFISNLQHQKRLIFSHLFVLCMHVHANLIYSATASSVPIHRQSPWLHHRAVERHKTELVISEYVYCYTATNVPVASIGHFEQYPKICEAYRMEAPPRFCFINKIIIVEFCTRSTPQEKYQIASYYQAHLAQDIVSRFMLFVWGDKSKILHCQKASAKNDMSFLQ